MSQLTPETISICELPSVELRHRRKLPNVSAIYFVMTAYNELLYIGMTKSLCIRWIAHHRLDTFIAMGAHRIAWLEVSDSALLNRLEIAFITHYKPALNGIKLKEPIVTLHLKTDRVVRDQLLGTLRARGTTMQQFFDTLMRMLVDHPEYIDQIEHWDDDDEESVRDARFALA